MTYPDPTFSGFSCIASTFCRSDLGLGSTLSFVNNVKSVCNCSVCACVDACVF